MAEGINEIFILDQGSRELRSVPLRPMRLGVFGTSLEDALQTLLETPGIIPGAQIDPVSDDPPSFALLRREMPIGGWSLDHLYVDQSGMLTLVESKLLQNPESRREVIGQIVEYAANARDAWASGRVKELAIQYWKDAMHLDNALHKVFPNLDLDDLWQNVETKLEQGSIRLIIAADSIRPEVRRMIEYLNSEMRNVTVLGLELQVYAEAQDQGQIIIVPRIIGQAQANLPPSNGKVSFWNVSNLRNEFGKMPIQEANPLIELLEWSLKKECFLGSRALSPSFGLASRKGDRLFSVSSSGKLYLHFGKGEEYRYSGGSTERDQLVSDLKGLGLIAASIKPEEVVSGRNLGPRLSELDRDTFDKLLDILSRYCKVPIASAQQHTVLQGPQHP